MANQPAQIVITEPGLHRLQVWMREDGLRLDRILLSTDETIIPTGDGPPATSQP